MMVSLVTVLDVLMVVAWVIVAVALMFGMALVAVEIWEAWTR